MSSRVRIWLLAVNVAAIVAGIALGRWIFYAVTT
jgi:hypothetical protein